MNKNEFKLTINKKNKYLCQELRTIKKLLLLLETKELKVIKQKIRNNVKNN